MNLLTTKARACGLVAAATLGIGLISAAAAPAAGARSTTPECSTAELGARLLPGSPGAGQRYGTVVLTNTGGRTCTVTGYGGLGLLGGPRQGGPIHLRPVASPAPHTVTLAPRAPPPSLLHLAAGPPRGEKGAARRPTAATG